MIYGLRIGPTIGNVDYSFGGSDSIGIGIGLGITHRLGSGQQSVIWKVLWPTFGYIVILESTLGITNYKKTIHVLNRLQRLEVLPIL